MKTGIKNSYKATKYASYTGYVTQAIVNNFAPLLFVTFSGQFDLNLADLSILIVLNFATQMCIDFTSAWFVKPVGLKRCCVLAHVFAALGLVFYGTLPFLMNPFTGLIIANMFCAIGGGLDEVVISPVVEALPGDAKASAMSMLHSFYCWGQVLVVAVSTVIFLLLGVEHWPVLSIIWALIPAVNSVLFCLVPVCELNEGSEDTPIKELLSRKIFWAFLIIMVCAGASELAMSQWASLFAEEGLHVSKTTGDLLGPCTFALLMGIVRLFFGIFGEKMDLAKFIFFSGVLCIISYVMVAFSENPYLSLSGCALCGLSVGLMWPGTYSLASRRFEHGGTKMFSILALFGDIGCTLGPALAGFVGDATGFIRDGFKVSLLFPAILSICMLFLLQQKKK